MVPRPETPEPPDVGNGADGVPPSAHAVISGASTPTRRNRRPRSASTSTHPSSSGDDPASAASAAASSALAAAERYGPGSAAALGRHVLSPAPGGGQSRLVRRPAAERTLTRLCTLALPPLANAAAAARGSADAPPPAAAGTAAAAAAAALAEESSDARSVSSRLSHGTGTTAPVTNTAAGSGVDPSNQQQPPHHPGLLEAAFPPARPSFAPGCSPLVVFGRYVAAATDDGRICLFAVRSFEDNVDVSCQSNENKDDDEEDWDALERMRDRIDRIEDERSAVGPVAAVGPFRVGVGLMSQGGGGDQWDADAGYIVALAATPADVSLPTYRRRRKRRRPPGGGEGDAEEDAAESDEPPPPPPPPPKAGHRFLGHITALTTEGDVHVLQIYERDDDSRSGSSLPYVEVLASFSTMTFCASCICIRSAQGVVEGDGDGDGDGATVPTMRICVGHDNGVIGEWELVVTCDTPFVSAAGCIRRPTMVAPTGPETEGESVIVPTVAPSPGSEVPAKESDSASPSDTTQEQEEQNDAGEDAQNEPTVGAVETVAVEAQIPETQPPPLKYSTPRPRLVWAGQLDAPIRSLSSLGDGALSSSEDAELVRFQQTHIAIGLAQRADSTRDNPLLSASSSLPPSLAIEVVDALQAESEWQRDRSKRDNTDDMSPQSRGLDPVNLCDLCTWPGVGMEIRDGSMISELQNGSGSGYKASRIDEDMVRGFCLGLKNTPGFAIAVSDGTVAVSRIVKQSNGLVAWGVVDNQDQIFLPGPPIGMGIFSGGAAGSSLAYCLQGGLVFVASEINSNTGSVPQIISYQCPFELEGDGDDAVRFAHGFIAGNIVVAGWEASTCMPILGFSWAGGLMDIFNVGEC